MERVPYRKVEPSKRQNLPLLGCLPSDLGRGIRPVVQKEGERSDIKNGFWIDEPGFRPVMIAMGLNPLAFTVARNSLIAEGPCETILLPTLIRQATGKSELDRDDLTEIDRVEAVKEWCEDRDVDPPSKTNISQRLVKMASDGKDIIDPAREEILTQIDDWATEHFIEVVDSN